MTREAVTKRNCTVLVPYVGVYAVPVHDVVDEEEAWEAAIDTLGSASNRERDELILEEELLDRIQEEHGTACYSTPGVREFEWEDEL